MRQALHILAEDIRHLWPQIVVVWLFFALHAYFDIVAWPLANNQDELHTANMMFEVLWFVLPLTIWVLIALVVFEEALPGDRQFWLTRPYRRGPLLTAKVIFVLLFVNLPFFLSDCSILASQAFVPGVLPSILLRQLTLTVVFVLPPFVVAAVTSGMAQFLLAWFLLLLAFVLETLLSVAFTRERSIAFGMNTGELMLCYVAIVCLAALVWQYATRRTIAARIWLAAAVLVAMPALSAEAHLFAKFRPATEPPSSPSPVTVSYDLSPNKFPPDQDTVRGMIVFRFGLHVAGLSAETLLRGYGPVSIFVNGREWNRGWKPSASVEQLRDEYVLTFGARRSDVEPILEHPVGLRTELALESVTDTPLVREPATTREFRMPEVGPCRTFRGADNDQLICRAGLERHVEIEVRLLSGPKNRMVAVFGPRSLPYGLSSTSDALGVGHTPEMAPDAQLVFIPRRTLARFKRASGIRLADYAVAAQRAH